MKKNIFIGREKELATLNNAFSDVSKGLGKLVLIEGNEGSGKSTLVRNFLNEISNEEILIGISECNDKENLNAYAPFKELLIQLNAGGNLQQKDDKIKKLKDFISEAGSSWISLIPVVGNIASTGISTYQAYKKTYNNNNDVSNINGEQDIYRIFENEFRRLAKNKTVVIFIDDLQWADASSLNLIFALGKIIRSNPFKILIIGSFRPNEIKAGRNKISETGAVINIRHPFSDKLNELRNYCKQESHIIENINWFIEIPIKPFSTKEIALLINSRFPNNNFNNDFFESINNLTDGQPLYIVEILEYLVRNKVVSQNEKGFTASKIKIDELPVSLNGVISEKVERLSSDLKKVLSYASINGEEFSVQIIEKILKMDELDLLEYLQELREKHELLEAGEPKRVKNLFMELYSFTQTMVQKYLYENMDSARRRALHRHIATTIKDLYGEAFIENNKDIKNKYNLHFQIGQGLIDGVNLSINTNESDENIAQKPDDSIFIDAVKTEIQNAKDSYEQYAMEECFDFINKSLAFLSKLNDDHSEKKIQKFETLLLKCKALQWQGHYQKAYDVAQNLIEISKEIQDQKYVGIANLCVAKSTTKLGNCENALLFLYEAIEIYSTQNELAILWEIYEQAGETKSVIASYDDAIIYIKKAMETAILLGDDNKKAQSLLNIGDCYRKKSEYKTANDYYKNALEIFENQNNQFQIGLTLNSIGLVLLDQQLIDKAIIYFEKALKIAQNQNDNVNVANRTNNVAIIYESKGKYDIAIEYYKKALAIDSLLDDKRMISKSYNNIGNVYISKGNYNIAQEYFDKSLAISESLNDKVGLSYTYSAIGHSLYAVDRTKESIQYLQKAIEIDLELGDKTTLANNYLGLGNAYYTANDFEATSKYYHKSIEFYKAVNDQGSIALINNNLGNLEHSKNNYSEALVYYNKSVNFYIEINNKLSQLLTEINMANCYQSLHDYDKAIELYKRTVSFAESIQENVQLKNAYKGLANTFYNKNDYENSVIYYKKLADLCIELNNLEELSYAYKFLGNSYYYNSKYQFAIEYYNKELNVLTQLNDESKIIECYFDIGLAYYWNDEYELAKSYFNKCLAYYEANNNNSNISKALENIGNCNNLLENYDLAIENYTKSIDFAEKINNQEQLSQLYSKTGNLYYDLKDFKNAILYYSKSEKINTALQLKENIANDYKFLGFSYFYDDQNNLAIENYNKQLAIEIELGEKENIADCYSNIGLAYYWNDQFPESIASYLKALDIQLNLPDESIEIIANTHIQLGRSYYFNNQYNEAIEHQLRALKLKKMSGTCNESEIDDLNFSLAKSYYFAESNQLAKVTIEKSMLFRKNQFGENSDEFNKVLDFYNKAFLNEPEATTGKSAPTSLNETNQINTASSENDIEFHIKSGDINYENQHYDNALNNYHNALELINKLPNNNDNNYKLAQIHYKLGMNYLKVRNYKVARGSLITATNGFIELLGRNNEETARSFSYLGDTYYYLDDYENAVNCHSEALNSYKSVQNDMMTAWCYHDLGEDYYWAENYEKSILNFKECLNLRIQIKGQEDKDVATAYFKLGRSYYWNEQYQLAILNQTKAYEMRKKIFGEDSYETDESRFELGKEYYYADMEEIAVDYLNQSLHFREKYFGEDSTQYNSVKSWIEKYLHST